MLLRKHTRTTSDVSKEWWMCVCMISAEEPKDGPAKVMEASLLGCLCSPQVVLHTHKLWDLLLVLPLPDLLLLVLKNKKRQYRPTEALLRSKPT